MNAGAGAIDDTLAALADPTRRRVVALLGARPHRAGEIAQTMRVSAPVMSRHLRVLRKAGLVREHGLEDDARVRVYELRPERFDELDAWLHEVRAFWRGQLEAFAAHVDTVARETR
jgi:DNA-binding transcriptional ArsR family regulator